jgi:hypothetical protein
MTTQGPMVLPVVTAQPANAVDLELGVNDRHRIASHLCRAALVP